MSPESKALWKGAVYLLVTLPFVFMGSLAAFFWTAAEIGWFKVRHDLEAMIMAVPERKKR